jgi:RNA polymerase sigma factor (sigma-70 family)
MTRDESTAALVAAAQAGDKDAFGVLVARYYPMTHATCARFLGDGDRALDVTQEAVVTAMLSLDRLRDGTRFGAWLTGIALNLCRRLVRDRDWASFSLDALLAAGLVAEPADGGPSPDDAAAAADVARRVRAAVAALPPGQRAAAEAYYLSGLPAADSAERIAVPATALKARLYKARKSLRASLLDLRPERRPAMTSAQPEKDPAMVPVTISSALLYKHDTEGDEGGRRVPHHWMKLTESGGDRALFIGVGQAEAVALALSLDGREFPRPMTYQFAAALLESSGTELREVRITRLTDGVFYAQAELSNGTVVDARPSDALNLAAITGAPVLVATDLLDLITSPDIAPET